MFANDASSILRAPRTRRIPYAPISEYAGLWKGALHPTSSGTIPFTMRQEDFATGVHPVLLFPTRAIPPVAVRLLEASATAYEAATEPFVDPSVGALVTLHIRGARRHNRLTGTFELRRDDGTVVRAGHFAAARYASASQVNYRW